LDADNSLQNYPKELLNVQGSDTTKDDSSKAAKFIVILRQAQNGKITNRKKEFYLNLTSKLSRGFKKIFLC